MCLAGVVESDRELEGIEQLSLEGWWDAGEVDHGLGHGFEQGWVAFVDDRLGGGQFGELGLGLGALLGELLVTLPDAGSPVGGIGGGLFQFGDEVVLACGDVVEVAARGVDGALVFGGFLAWDGVVLVGEVSVPVGSEDAGGDQVGDGG